MNLSEAKWCPQASIMLHDGKEISDSRKSELKAIYLEGLIRFLDIYAQTEIGEGFDIDIMKVALYVNSANFENDELYSFNCIEDIYRLCESLVLAGLPLWRFLKLNEWQNNMLERGYDELLIFAKKQATDEKPCYGCIWYEEFDTFLGTLRKCNKPTTEFEYYRRGGHDPDEIKECEWSTTLTSIPKSVDNLSSFRKDRFIGSIESARNKFKRELLKDPFRIPKTISDKDSIELDKEYDFWDDFGCAFRNERTKSEKQHELRKAMFVEGMIRFFEIFAKIEMGNNYVPNIKHISLWVDNPDLKCEIVHIKCFEDVYVYLENMILDGLDVNQFVKFDTEV